MDLITEKHIDSARDFISASGSWSEKEVAIFLVIGFVAIVLILVYFFQKIANKQGDKMIDVTMKTTEVVANNTIATKESTDVLRHMLERAIDKHGETQHIIKTQDEKLDDIGRDIKDIKDKMEYKYGVNGFDLAEFVKKEASNG